MKLLLLLGIFLFAKFITAKVICDFSDRFIKIREDVREKISSNGLIYAIVDYVVLKNFSEGYPIDNLKFLTNFEIDLKIPAVVTYSARAHYHEMYIYSSHGDIGIGYLNFTTHTLDISHEFLNEDECSGLNPSNTIHWTDDWSDPHCFLLFVCEVRKPSQTLPYGVRRKIIILTDRMHNRSKINSYMLRNNYTRKFVEFSEFGSRGFCICDDINFYLNDCTEKENQKDPEVIYHFVIIMLNFVLLFINYEIYCCLIGE